VLAHLGFHRRDQRLQPGFGFAVGNFEHLHHLARQRFKKTRGQLVLTQGQHLENRVEAFLENALQSRHFLAVLFEAVIRRVDRRQSVFVAELLVHRRHHGADFLGDRCRCLQVAINFTEEVPHRLAQPHAEVAFFHRLPGLTYLAEQRLHAQPPAQRIDL
jgi:hypothetical protein